MESRFFLPLVHSSFTIAFTALGLSSGCDSPTPPAARVSSIPTAPPPPPPSTLTAPGPSLRDITAVYYTELPGVDIPNEPPPRKPGESVTFQQQHEVNKNTAILPLLKGFEKLYTTNDQQCEVWIPGGIVLLMTEGRKPMDREYLIRTPSEQVYAFDFREASMMPGETPEQAVKKIQDDLAEQWIKDGGRVIHRRGFVTNEIQGEEVMVQSANNRVALISRTFCVDSTLYCLGESALPRSEPTSTGKKYFESFKRRKG